MADSPGKVLSSFASSNERNGSTTKGCAGMFFQLLDRFNGKKLFPHKLLPSERPKHNIISHTEEKLPMAKLLLIADENRIGSSRRDGDSSLDETCQKNKDCEERERRGKKSVGVVARLMGLETMPSPEPPREKKQIEVFRNTKEGQSTRKLLQSRPILVKEGGKKEKVINSRIQILQKMAKPSQVDQLHRFEAKISALNSVTGALKQSTTKARSKPRIIFQSCEMDTKVKLIKVEDPKALFFSKLPAMPSFQVESPLRSILSPSRTSSKLLSPIKSPLSSKRTACLFGAAGRVLEPNLRPAKNRGFHQHNMRLLKGSVGEDTNEQKITTVGALPTQPLDQTAESRNSAAKHQLNSEQGVASLSPPSMFTECKGQATSRRLNYSSERKAQSSSREVNALTPFIRKQDQAKNSWQVKHERKSIIMPTSQKKLATPTSQSQEVSCSTDGGARLLLRRKSNKTLIKGSKLDSRQDNAALPVHIKEENANQEEASKRLSQRIVFSRGGFNSLGPRSTKGSNISTISQPSRTDKSSQDFTQSTQTSSEVMNQEGRKKCVKISSPNVGKVMSLSKTTITGLQSKSIKSAHSKGDSPLIRPSAKRKAGNYLAKPHAQEEVLTAIVGDFIPPSILEEQSDFYQSDLDVPRVSSFDGNNANSRQKESVVHTRVRARWDIGDEIKRNITKNCISFQKPDPPLAECHLHSNSTRDALQTSQTAAGILEELLLSLNASTSQFCEDGSGVLFKENKTSCTDLMDFSTDSSPSLNHVLQEAEQIPQSYANTPPKENTSIRDCESLSDSLCAEEFEHPSPISILESPFQDSASSSSDSFETSNGRTQWEVNANELFDCLNIMGTQIEVARIHDTQTMADGNKLIDVKSGTHCIHPAPMDEDAIIDTAVENEDAYVKTFEAAAFSAIWERLDLPGALLDPAVLSQLEKQSHHLPWTATVLSNLCIENDSNFSPCRRIISKSFMRWQRESPLQKRELFYDCIEEALRLSLELARQSYGFSVPYMRLPVAYFLKGVCKQIEEWKGLALSMNLDDMMKMEINTGMGRWFKFGNEVEKLAENIEAMIVRSLMDELMEVVIETPVSHVCS